MPIVERKPKRFPSSLPMIPNSNALPMGATIGILGGGQLGRMLALAAARLGFRTHIYCPDPQSPAFDVTPRSTVAAYDDETALAAFASAVDVITYEFENVPAETAAFLSRLKPLRPDSHALGIAQDRLAEKAFLSLNRVPVAGFAAVPSLDALDEAIADLGYPAVLKTTRLGYDGKGQRMIRDEGDAAVAFEQLSPKPLVLEGFVAFEKEISVIVARGASGTIAAYDPAENVHRDHILKTSTVPAAIGRKTATEAVRLASRIAEALDYVGVLGVEFFVLPKGGLLVNEIAPRVHNSGHWTEAVCVTDQFEQHIRAVAGWPLGETTRHANVVMENLIGDEIADIPGNASGSSRVHAYGKTESRPGRKMGHINRLQPKNAKK